MLRKLIFVISLFMAIVTLVSFMGTIVTFGQGLIGDKEPSKNTSPGDSVTPDEPENPDEPEDPDVPDNPDEPEDPATSGKCLWCGSDNLADGKCSWPDCPTYERYVVTFTTKGIASCSGVNDATWILYDADSDEEIDRQSAMGTPVDFSGFMTVGSRYYVVLTSISDNSGSCNTFTSNTIVFEGDLDLDLDVAFSKFGVASADTGDATWTLYNAMTGEEVYSIGGCGYEVVFSEYMIPGNQYYVELSNVHYIDAGYLPGPFRSDTILYEQEAYSVTLNESGEASASATDATWTLYDALTGEMIREEPACGSPMDFSSYMTVGNSYYVELSDIWVGGQHINGTFRSNTITYKG